MTQPVAEYSLDLSGLADPVGLALSVGEQTYRVIGMQPGRNGDLSISWRTRCATCGPALWGLDAAEPDSAACPKVPDAPQPGPADRWPVGPREKGQTAAAIRAAELLGKELGMFIERREQGKPGDFADLPEEELDRRIIAQPMVRGMTERQARAVVREHAGPDQR